MAVTKSAKMGYFAARSRPELRPDRAGLGLAAIIAFCAGCSADPASETSPSADPATPLGIDAITPGLAPGARGPEVAAVYEYLFKIGYFPNEALRQQHPAWTPVVPDTPSDRQYFGAELERAIAEFQVRGHLQPTGIVDEATLNLMRTRACGAPDFGIADPTEKWAHLGTPWTLTNITYRITQYTSDISQASVNAAVDGAFATWAAASNLNFTRISSGTPNIDIKFYPNASTPPGWSDMDLTGFGGRSTAPNCIFGCVQVRIGINDATNWAVQPPNEIDLQGLLTHETGHAIGLHHSSITIFGSPVMEQWWPATDLHRTLRPDDKTGITSRYGVWQVTTAPEVSAVDVGGIGADVWVASASHVSQWNGSAWTQIAGPAGVTLAAVAAGGANTPWVVGTNNTIWTRSQNSWVQRPGSATDIAVAPFEQVWAIGASSQGGGNFNVQRWNGSAWIAVAGAAKRIAVDLGNRPWVVRNGGAIFRRNAADTGWDLMPGCATDIAAGMDGSIWVLGCNVVNGSERDVYVWNEQPAVSGNNGTPGAFQWQLVAGAGSRIGMGPDQRPWVRFGNGALARRQPRCNPPNPFCA